MIKKMEMFLIISVIISGLGVLYTLYQESTNAVECNQTCSDNGMEIYNYHNSDRTELECWCHNNQTNLTQMW